MLALRLAYRNLMGKKLRAWLNVGVLSFTYVLIIWHQGIFSGMYQQAATNSIKDEIGGGQYWHKNYDPFDPLTLEESHGPVPPELVGLVDAGKAIPILIRQATIYPEGRVQSILLKGIDPLQQILEIPTASLDNGKEALSVMAGKIMARRNSFKVGDLITIRWRDARGTFDAAEGEIVRIMSSIVPTVDAGQLWLPLNRVEGDDLPSGRGDSYHYRQGCDPSTRKWQDGFSETTTTSLKTSSISCVQNVSVAPSFTPSYSFYPCWPFLTRRYWPYLDGVRKSEL